ncbi:MAG: DsbC family protein [Pseudomonadota bacterium]
MSTLFRTVLLILLSATAANAAADDAFDAVRESLASKFPNLEAQDIYKTPLPGIVQVRQGPMVAYLTEDGRFLVRGDLIDLESDRNLTQDAAAAGRVDLLSEFDDGLGVTFAPKNPKHTVTVFTDVDCGWCRELHKDIQAYNDLGIAVRYLLWPRGGPGSENWLKAEQVWCAEDRNDALTRAKNDESLPAKPKGCDTSVVMRHFETGLRLGVGGTPSIVTDTGQFIPGYKPAEDLAALLANTPTVSTR